MPSRWKWLLLAGCVVMLVWTAAMTIDSLNDGAILALKTWHRPLDPHTYDSKLRGALALPMLARGRLLGILLLDERAGGEAYAPDEVDALGQFAQGVGSSLDALGTPQDGDIRSRLEELKSIMLRFAPAGPSSGSS